MQSKCNPNAIQMQSNCTDFMRFPHRSTWFAMVSERPEVCWCTPSCWSGHDCTNTEKFGNIFHFCSKFSSQFPRFQALLLEPNRPELHLGCPLLFLSVWTITVTQSVSNSTKARRGQCLMQLDKLEEALTSFEAELCTVTSVLYE